MSAKEQKMDYKRTLNLPATRFPMKANLNQREPEILQRWNQLRLYQRILERQTGKPNYTLHDGPPYANGNIHLGTALNKILKDFVVRAKTMEGHYANYVPGWDCHGLPIELKVVGEFSLEYSSANPLEIRRLCHDYAMKYVNIQREQFQRLGVTGDWDSPYLTLTPGYEAGILAAFRALVEEGLIYRGLKPVHWCSSCRTALAEAEVEYEDRTSHTVYVRFPLLDHEKREAVKLLENPSILIWTTTPWTLPGNLAVCLHPDHLYVAMAGKGETLILAKDLAEAVAADCNLGDYRIVSEFKGRELEGLHCAHPLLGKPSLVILGEHVTLDQGTGCVHTAPGHGNDDYVVGQKYGLPVFVPVDDAGCFTSGFPLMEGMLVWDTNVPIINYLKEKKLLVKNDTLVHSYPHCWRCHNPIIFRATEQLFMSLDKNQVRERALKAIDEVQWIPRWGRERIYNMVEMRPDWCLSRQRCWGVPIPAVTCSECGAWLLELAIIDRTIEQVREYGTDVWYREPVERFVPEDYQCPRCEGKEFRKEYDILDVWFDSGASHIAALEPRDDLSCPADLYLEGSDQHRGWFQSSLLVSIGARDRAPYRAVLTHGFTLDEKGEAMSKSKGNVISPLDIVEELGADVLRLWVASEDYRNDMKVSHEILERIADAYRRLRNTFKFILGNLNDFDPKLHTVSYSELEELDQWALHQLAILAEKVRRAYGAFEFHKVYHLTYTFCVVEMSAFYLDVLKDRIYTSAKDDRTRHAAHTTLHHILDVLLRLLAPIIPFTTDEAWGFMNESEPSVHVVGFPIIPEEWTNEALAQRWETLLGVRSEVCKALEVARHDRLIGHSLDAEVFIQTPNKNLYDVLRRYLPQLASLFIVSGCAVEKVDALEPGEVAENQLPVRVTVKPASGSKCERCWKFSIDVGSQKDHPSLCQRCVEVVRRNKQ
jgi:isoleucyl-tRNA synthetase